jgi:hypothetical protein
VFEKEAEEYKNNTRIKDKNTYVGFPNERISELQDFEGNYIDISERIIKTFKDGAEFGYNKANEWYKPSEKLPKECSLVIAYGFDDTEPDLYYFVASDTWELMPRRIVFLSNDQIKLWKEIVRPEIDE